MKILNLAIDKFISPNIDNIYICIHNFLFRAQYFNFKYCRDFYPPPGYQEEEWMTSNTKQARQGACGSSLFLPHYIVSFTPLLVIVSLILNSNLTLSTNYHNSRSTSFCYFANTFNKYRNIYRIYIYEWMHAIIFDLWYCLRNQSHQLCQNINFITEKLSWHNTTRKGSYLIKYFILAFKNKDSTSFRVVYITRIYKIQQNWTSHSCHVCSKGNYKLCYRQLCSRTCVYFVS